METVAINISNFPAELKESLVKRAEENKRSMASEMIYILTKVIEKQISL
jgi:plasmid stability protein